MRKITFLFYALLFCCFGAAAQPEDLLKEGERAIVNTEFETYLNAAEAYLMQETAPKGAVGTKLNLDFKALREAKAAAENNPNEETKNKLVNLLNDIDNEDVVEIVPNKYYRIINADEERSENQQSDGFLFDPTRGGQNSFLRCNLITEDNVDAIFRIEEYTAETDESNKCYCIKHCNQELYMQGVRGLLGNKNAITFVPKGNAKYIIYVSGDACYEKSDKSLGSASSDNIENPTTWYIVPATNMKVAMNPDDDGNYWSSTYLPFDVSTENATILIGEKVNNSYLSLSEVETLPAKTGAILYMESEADNANGGSTVYCTLNIVDNSDAAATNTTEPGMLTGTLTDLGIGEEGWKNYFVLGMLDEKVGLYHPEGNTLKANKAYLEVSDVQSNVNGLRFSFGEVTGIDNAAAERNTDTGAVYDLSGRRVAAPASGIYVKDGKKIFVR